MDSGSGLVNTNRDRVEGWGGVGLWVGGLKGFGWGDCCG